MSEQDIVTECGTDVLVSFPESLHIYTGLLTVATVCGVLTGIFTAALLYNFCLKPLILTRQGYNVRRLLEPDDEEVDNNQSVSTGRKDVPSVSAKDKEKKQPPTNSDVAAFATRAKVVYPINQKYRPLADGASNPSLHEHSKLPAMPNESSSSSDEESLSQEQDNDDSGQYVSSSLVPKSLQNHSFTRVSHYPLTLTQTGSFDGRINLYCLALHDVQQSCIQLQQEKSMIYFQIIKTVFGCRFPKTKQEADFYKNILQMQENELNEMRKLLPTSQTTLEKNDNVSCALEEIERAQKELLEHCLQMSKDFCKQVEDLSQHLLRKSSVFCPDEAQDVVSSIIKTLLVVENHLKAIQDSNLNRIQLKVLWWEELTALLQSQPALLRQEVALRQCSITTTLEQLTSDDVLTFGHMEKVLLEIQGTLTDGLKQCSQEFTKKTKELVTEKSNKMESKRKKLLKSQLKEKNRVLEQTLGQNDLQELIKVYQELLLKHRQQIYDLELQQDNRVAEAVCDLWRKLRASWSKRLRDLSRDVFLSTVTTESNLSVEQCEKLWLDLEQTAQLQEVECTTRQQMEDIRAQLDKDGQTWSEEMTLVHACLRHLSEQQTKILQSMVVRQSYTLNSQVERLIEKKHGHLLMAVQRHFVVRHFCLHMLKEMRLSKLKVLSQTDFRALLIEDNIKSQPCSSSAVKNSSASLAERHLGPESQLVGHSFQQEFLSELETGMELLQSHAQQILGNALSHAIQQLMETQPSEAEMCSKQDYNMKVHLTEAASESVYMTKESLTALVKRYHSELETITKKLQQDQPNVNTEISEKQESSSQINKALLRELVNWSKKPTSAEFQQRVELHKRRLLGQCDKEQEILYEELRHKKVSQEITMEKIKAQLLEAEESFIEELTALARVSLRGADAEPSEEEDNVCDPSTNILDLLALNPALDPALNPSLTPTVIAPPVKIIKKKKT